MNFDNFTIKSQEAIQQAVNIVRQNNGQSIEPVHLLKAIIDKGESVVKFIFQKLGVNENQIKAQWRRAVFIAGIKRYSAKGYRAVAKIR